MNARTQTAYHRIAHDQPNYRWWRPLVALATAVGLYFGMGVALLVVILLGMVGWELLCQTSLAGSLTEFASAVGFDFGADSDLEDMGNPLTLLLLCLSLFMFLPCCLVATRIAWRRPAGQLSSVAGRLRWRRVWVSLCIAAAVIVPVLLAYALLAGRGPQIMFDAHAVVLLAVIIVLVPLQAAAEEYLFRGFLAQIIGSWLRHPAWAILLPVPIFVLGHTYDWTGLVDVAVFAVVTGVLAYRTGGIEAGIALHVVNNVTIFALGAVGLADMNAESESLVGLGVSLIVTIGVGLLLLRVGGRAEKYSVAAGR
jgi:membrane protease YdiL (CAAX protease family)